jgi:hypothetical protein
MIKLILNYYFEKIITNIDYYLKYINNLNLDSFYEITNEIIKLRK